MAIPRKGWSAGYRFEAFEGSPPPNPPPPPPPPPPPSPPPHPPHHTPPPPPPPPPTPPPQASVLDEAHSRAATGEAAHVSGP